MGASEREYDRFGPWIVELSEEDPPPRLFAPHLPGGHEPLLAIKIPRRIERRLARPGMDLYDYVVAVYEDELVIMRRVGDSADVERWRISDLRDLRVTRDLLRGNLRLGLPGRRYDLPYSTVSHALMARLVELLRTRYRPAARARSVGPDVNVPDGTLSYHFTNLLAQERQDDTGMRLDAVQGTRPVESRSRYGLRRLVHRVADKRLLESLHFSDGIELKIRTRGGPYAYRWQAVYGVETTFVPIDNVLAAEWHDDSTNGATVLSLRTASGESEYVFAADNAGIDSYARRLRGWLAG